MHAQVKNRDWVKNAAIIFLSIMLVLTFFSNTIMNRSLPEVSTQEAVNGNIVAKVRGTGVVVANGSYQEKAAETREIRAVLIKEGQQINAGDPMFVLGEGNSEELEALQEQLRSLNVSYQRGAINLPDDTPTLEEKKMNSAYAKLKAAESAEKAAKAAYDEAKNKLASEETDNKIKAAEKELEKATESYNVLLEQAKAEIAAAEEKVEKAREKLDDLIQKALIWEEEAKKNPTEENNNSGEDPDTDNPPTTPEDTPPTTPEINPYDPQIEQAKVELAAANEELKNLNFSALDVQEKHMNTCQERLDSLLGAAGPAKAAYEAAVEAREEAQEEYDLAKDTYDKRKNSYDKSLQLAYLDLGDIGAQINKVKEKIKELSGGEENQILAKVSGTVQSVEIMAGSTAQEGNVLCTIEVPDMGYNLSFSVTNEQARRLKPGDSATVSNFYWGNEIVATLSTIKTDPKNPMTNKLLTFDLTGDVTAGGELSISVGQKSAGYEIVIPNSAIKNDTNGSFVYIIEAKNSPLGNRYKAKRANVEVLASDDNNSAVTGDIQFGDYVITISNAPIKNGELVRMADS